jgi:hypothetical protein
MPVLGLAALNVHKLVELQHSPLTAAPALAPFMEDRCAWVMYTALTFPVAAFVSGTTSFPSAGHALFERYAWIVVFGLWRRRRRGWRLRGGLCSG